MPDIKECVNRDSLDVILRGRYKQKIKKMCWMLTEGVEATNSTSTEALWQELMKEVHGVF